MKKFFSIIAATIMCAASVLASPKYAVEVNITTKQVTIVQDGKVIKGTRNQNGNLATVKLEKGNADKMLCSLESIKGCSVPSIEPCVVSSDGTITFYGMSYNDPIIKSAFKEAMAYLKKTDQPISVDIYQGN